MTEMRLKQSEFTNRARGPFTKNKERTQKFKEPRDSRYFYQSKLIKACFQHEMACGDFKDLTRSTDFDTILRDKALILLKFHNMMDINMHLF